VSDSKQIKYGEYSNTNEVKLVRGGKPYFTLLEQLIDNAKYSIHLQVYIFIEDTTGNVIAEALIRAAQRGVKVYFIIDGYASARISDHLYTRFSNAGLHYRRFEPFFKNRYFYFGRRMHQKVFVADACHALVAGINICDRYNDMPHSPAWFDMALYVHGETAYELERVCVAIWNRSYANDIQSEQTLRGEYKNYVGQIENNVSVRVRINDWVKMKNDIWKSYFNMFNHATESIVIVCSYFVPGWVYRKAIVKAVKRGVKVKVVLAGRSDVMLAKYAERYLYRWMFRNNIEVYEYDKNILHAKLAIQDSKWMTVGSYNVNDLSASASIELNLDVRNRPFAEEAEALIEKIIQEDCHKITSETYNTFSGAYRWVLHLCAFYITKMVLFLVTFYYKREQD
jgi:cardiolipin synthase